MHPLDELEKSIQDAKKKIDPPSPEPGELDVMRVSIELVAGVGVGVFLGYQLDRWLHTSPLFLLLCFFLGVAGSFLNIYRVFKQQKTAEGTLEKSDVAHKGKKE